MKNLLLLCFSLALYILISFILLLRDEWALKTIAAFYPFLSGTLSAGRELALNYHLNTAPTVIFAVIIAAAFFFYWRLITGDWIKGISPKSVLIISAVLQLALIFSYPALSSDVFDYVLMNRVTYTYRENPWITPSIAFPEDPFINLGSWQRIPTVYGPTHHFLSMIPAIIGGDDLIRSVLGYKLLMLMFAVIILKTLLCVLPVKNAARNLAIVALNPLFLIEFAGNAHNDIIMVFFMLCSFAALGKKRTFLSGILIGLGTMLKLYAAVLLPLYIIFLWRKNAVDKIVTMLAGFLGCLIAGIWFMGIESLIAQAGLIKWVFGLRLNSLPNLLNKVPNWAFLIPFGFYAMRIIRRIDTGIQLIEAYVKLTVVYLMFVIPLYWAWYPVWYLPFLALMPLTKVSKAAIAFTLTSELHYAVLFLSHRFDYQHIFWTIMIYAVLAAPPILVYHFALDEKTT